MAFALREIEGGTGARRGTPTTHPVSHFQLPHPVVGAIRESPVPPQREPPIPPPSALADPRTPSPHRRGNPRGCPGPLRKSVHPEPVEGPSATNSTYRPALPQIVVPAEAGTQGRCAARRRLRPPSFLRPTSRHSCEGRNPEGRWAGQPHQHRPSRPPKRQPSVVGAFRESPVPPQREPPISPPSALADPRTPSPHRRGNPSGRPLPIALNQSKGTLHDRSVGATLVVALPRTPSPSATPHPDTASLPPRATLRYRRAMENAVQRPCQANYRAAITNRFVASALCVGDRVGFAHPKGRLFTMGEKFLDL